MTSIAEQLEPLLGNYDHLSPRIRHVEFDTSICGQKIDVRGSYISFRDGEATVDEFVDLISNHITAFCLPRSELLRAQNIAKTGKQTQAAAVFTSLAQRAQSLFIKAKKGSHRSGEAGEIILYILVEWLLKAPQIVSKMYLKTNHNMPVFGTDGIHARYCNQTDRLFLYWGESKAHKSLDGALDSALSSISEFLAANQQQREIEIVSEYLDLGDAPKATKNAILDYLDPYNETGNLRVPVFACLLAFNFEYEDASQEKTAQEVEKEFEARFQVAATKFITEIKNKIGAEGFSTKRFEFFLLPVPNVQVLRDKFQAKIGWPHA